MSDGRWYRDDHDLDHMLALASAAYRRDGPFAGYLYPGDIVWGLFQNLTIDPTTRVRLFDDASGDLAGFVWLYPPNAFALQTRPGTDLVAPMVRWAEHHLRAIADTPPETLSIDVPAADAALKAALAALGYRDTGHADYLLNHRDLRAPIPAIALVDGAVVRPVRLDDPAEVAARVDLHREVWVPSRFTVDGYARLREKPVYRPELDLVVVTPAGELASYCIVWWDPASRIGEFEPVGTAERFRGRGYGAALMRDGLRRLRALGAEHAVVISATHEAGAASRRLYAASGFDVAFRYETWSRLLAPAIPAR
jgi:ribosomal protein S18 acetylase RimI-like enzyme